MTRKERKQARKKVFLKLKKKKETELDALAKTMSILISKMTPPNYDKRGDTFFNGKIGCFPFGGVWGELAYCANCYYKNCCQKKDNIKWILVRGKWKLNERK